MSDPERPSGTPRPSRPTPRPPRASVSPRTSSSPRISSRPSLPALPPEQRRSSAPRLSTIERLTVAGRIARGTIAPTVAALREPTRLGVELWLRSLRLDRRAQAATAILVGLLLVTVAGALSPPLLGRADEVLRAPSMVHPFGTDALGRDVLMAILQGAAPTLAGGLIAASSAALIGVAAGALAGLLRGTFDVVVRRLIEVVQTVPGVMLVLIVQALLPFPSAETLLIAVVATRWAEFARVVRAEVLRVVTLDHVLAARALGASPSRILTVHVLPGVVGTSLVLTSFAAGSVVALQTTLVAVGLGGSDPLAWGALFAQVREHPSAWWLVAFPALFVFLTVASAALLGESMRDALDPHLRWEGRAGKTSKSSNSGKSGKSSRRPARATV